MERLIIIVDKNYNEYSAIELLLILAKMKPLKDNELAYNKLLKYLLKK